MNKEKRKRIAQIIFDINGTLVFMGFFALSVVSYALWSLIVEGENVGLLAPVLYATVGFIILMVMTTKKLITEVEGRK